MRDNRGCVWPDCLTAEQQQTLCDSIRRSMLGEDAGVDPVPDCNCAERQAANEAFDAVVRDWPEE